MLKDSEFQFSATGKENRGLFVEDTNKPIILYVEDTDNENVYRHILLRMFPISELKADIFSYVHVVAAGSKKMVIERYEHNRKNNTTAQKKFVYLLDGDFDRYINSQDMKHDTDVIYLEKYNIESYLLSEAISVLYIQDYIRYNLSECNREVLGYEYKDYETIRQMLDFEAWKGHVVGDSARLFLNYACENMYWLENKLYKTNKNTSNADRCLNNNNGTVMKDRIEAIIEESRKHIPNYNERIYGITILYKGINGDDFSNLICGKFLLKSLAGHIRNVFSLTSVGYDSLKREFLKSFDVNLLSGLKVVIKRHLISVMLPAGNN
ncbi:MAG: DUF4435 domain-containing protein [Phascolarctobacterium sp.]|nr:DUF4435 domain-containing protein [Phascolarctobacterium sp.]